MACSLDYIECPALSQPVDLTMRSSDGRFSVHVKSPETELLLTACRESGHLETGGLLVGRYNEVSDTAIVTQVWGPPKDSVRKPASFQRGTQGLQKKLDTLWKTREYYLGEWHYHPRGAGQPSSTDISQMIRIAKTSAYNTPEPILVVVGGLSWNLVAYVFPRSESPIRLDVSC